MRRVLPLPSVIIVILLGACTVPTRPAISPEVCIPAILPVTTSATDSAPAKVKQSGAFPRLANYYNHNHQSINRSQAASLAKWDLVVVNFNVVIFSPGAIRLIRKLNPNIKILVWVSAGLNQGRLGRERMLPGKFSENWILHHADQSSDPKPAAERRVIMWPKWPKQGARMAEGMNPASEWSTYLPRFVHEKLMSSKLFDGVFYDFVMDTVRRPNVDINNDGVADSQDMITREYQKGMTQILRSTRELLGSKAIIFGNPGEQWSDGSPYWDYANGHMQENALGTVFGSSWPDIWNIYKRNMQKPSPPTRIHWIAADTNQKEFDSLAPCLPSEEVQKMRFGLTITLMGDGYFGFDVGDGFHGQLWWFREYNANLGFARGDAHQRGDGTWIREFENGSAIANPTTRERIIELSVSHKDVTTGTQGSHFVVPPKDGRIFTR